MATFATVLQGREILERHYDRTTGEVSDALLLDWLNDLNHLLYPKLVNVDLARFIKITPINIVSGTNTYSLPTKFDHILTKGLGEDEGCGIFIVNFSLGSGTISTVGTALTGVDTLFSTELVVGDVIVANGESVTILTIADDTNAVLSVAPSVDFSGDAYNILGDDTKRTLTRTGFGSQNTGYYFLGTDIIFTPKPTKDETVKLRFIEELAQLEDENDEMIINIQDLTAILNWLDKDYGNWNINIIKENNADARFLRGLLRIVSNARRESIIFDMS